MTGKHVVPSHPVFDPLHPKHDPHRPVYTTIIDEKEFAMSDEISTIVAAFYGHEVAVHAHFFVNWKKVEHHSLIDEHQGETLCIKYEVPKDKSFEIDPDWITSIAIPKGYAL